MREAYILIYDTLRENRDFSNELYITNVVSRKLQVLYRVLPNCADVWGRTENDVQVEHEVHLGNSVPCKHTRRINRLKRFVGMWFAKASGYCSSYFSGYPDEHGMLHLQWHVEGKAER